jgi:hypothetical protein
MYVTSSATTAASAASNQDQSRKGRSNEPNTARSRDGANE